MPRHKQDEQGVAVQSPDRADNKPYREECDSVLHQARGVTPRNQVNGREADPRKVHDIDQYDALGPGYPQQPDLLPDQGRPADRVKRALQVQPAA